MKTIEEHLKQSGFYKESHLEAIKSFLKKYPNLSFFCQEYGEWVCLIDKDSYCWDFNPHGIYEDRYIKKPAGIIYDYTDDYEPCCLGLPYEVGYNGALRINVRKEDEILIKE